MTIPRILYDNLYRADGGTLSYDGSTFSTQPPESAVDWLDYTTFLVVDADSNLDYLLPDGGVLDSWAWLINPPSEGETVTLTLQYESAPAVFTTIDSVTLDENAESPGLLLFDEITVDPGRSLRLNIQVTGGDRIQIRQFSAGPILEMETGEHGNLKPQTLTGGGKYSNSISENGSMLGRNKVRSTTNAPMTLTLLSQEWIRTTWEPFAEHAEDYCFWYAWNYDDRPDEITFASATTVEKPMNSHPPGKMDVTLPMTHIAS